MKRFKEKVEKPEKSESSNFLILAIILVVFLVSLGVSYAVTKESLVRKMPVSVAEVANSYANTISTQDLNNLYLENQLPDTVPVLAYHQIREIEDSDTRDEKLFITTPETFAKEMKYLNDHNYTVITLVQYLKFLQDKSVNPISKNSVVITFDDGYASQYTNAFPILKKYNMVATFFLYTVCLDKYPICLTKNEISELVKNGMRLGNHTEDHPYLTDYKKRIIKKEITEAEKYLKANWPEAFDKVLAYPYGLENEDIVQVLKDLDYTGAVGVSFYAKNPQDIYNLPRYVLGDNFQNFLNIFQKNKE